MDGQVDVWIKGWVDEWIDVEWEEKVGGARMGGRGMNEFHTRATTLFLKTLVNTRVIYKAKFCQFYLFIALIMSLVKLFIKERSNKVQYLISYGLYSFIKF